MLTDCMKQEFETGLRNRMSSGAARRGKLLFLLQMCPEPTRAPYLDYMPHHHVTALFRLLTSGHHFHIETGRWKHVPQEDRLCAECGILDTEEHAVFQCDRYYALRSCVENELAKYGFNSLTECTKSFLNFSVTSTPTEPLFFCLANFLRKVLNSAYLFHKAGQTMSS